MFDTLFGLAATVAVGTVARVLLEQGRAALAFANLSAQRALGMVALQLRLGVWSAQTS